MTVRKPAAQTKEKNYQPGPAAIPEVLFEMLLEEILNRYYEKIIVDIIEAGGTITPILISKAETEHTITDEETPYVLTVEFLSRPRSSQQIYLDNQKQISKILLKQQGISLERSDAENVIREFPERSDYILQNKIPEQDRLIY